MSIYRSTSASPAPAMLALCLLACCALVLPSVAAAAWRLLETSAEPGAALSGGHYRLQLVLGQPDAGAISTAGQTLEGGFLRAAVQRDDALFSDGFESTGELP